MTSKSDGAFRLVCAKCRRAITPKAQFINGQLLCHVHTKIAAMLKAKAEREVSQ